jgi:hypothetical protein
VARCAGAVGDMKKLVEKALTAAARGKRFVGFVCLFGSLVNVFDLQVDLCYIAV